MSTLIWKNEKIEADHLNRAAWAYSTHSANASKVAIIAPNGPRWIAALLGIWQANAIALPIDHQASSDEIDYILSESCPEVIFCSQDKVQQLNTTAKIVILDQVDITSVPANNTDFHTKFCADNNQTALLIYTSGTTGGPKGVMLSFANLFANLDGVCNQTPIFKENRPVLALLPFHHILPIMGTIIAPLYVNAPIVIAHSLDPAELMPLLKDNKVAIIIGVPRFYARLFAGIKSKIDQSTIASLFYKIAKTCGLQLLSKILFGSVQRKLGGKLLYLVSGGAALDQEVAHGLKTLGLNVLEGYGMSETAPMITFPRPGKVKLGTVGQALYGVEIKIEAGEIVVRGPNVMSGYYKKEKESNEAIVDGWLHTGDLGQIDSKGYLTIKGRAKELIVLPNGKNINPAEVEEKLLEISRKKDIRCNELAICQKGSGLHLFFVTNDLSNRAQVWEEVISSYNQYSPRYKWIQSFQLQKESLPKTRLEKIKRHLLPSLIHKQQNTSESPDFEELSTILNFIKEETGENVAAHSSFLGEIALDSLGQIGLFSEIKEKYQHDIDTDLLSQYDTPYKLATYIRDNDASTEEIELNIPQASFWARLVKSAISITLRVYFRIKRNGLIPAGSQIFVCNHQSFLDAPLLSVFFKMSVLKKTFFFAKAKHFNSKVMKFFAHTHNVIVFDQKSNLSQSIKLLEKLLREGKNIVIFPEGTRSHDGNLGEFKKTFAQLSKKIEVPITPISITGAHKAMPRGAFIPRPFTSIKINFLEQIFPTLEQSDEDLSAKTFEVIKQSQQSFSEI